MKPLVVAAALVVIASPLAAQQRDTLGRRDSVRTDSAHVQRLAPQVITGTRLSDVDEKTPLQVDRIDVHALPPGPNAAAVAVAKLPGVSLFDDQGSPAQPTLNVRGFQLSPVVGVPQGVSVFLDGVRINEPDAQQVNFDLIPMDAVARAQLVRGPATLFGKNTLAGAIVLTTQRGDSQPQLAVEGEGGSFGYRGARLTASGLKHGIDALVMANATESDGWRDQTTARTRMVFANIGRKRDSSDVALSVLYAHDRIMQAGSLPESWIHVDPRANYTAGDFFDPELLHLALRGEHALGGGTLRGNIYSRRNDVEQFNVNIGAPSTRAFIGSDAAGGTAEYDLPLHVAGKPLGLTFGAEYARNYVRYRIFQEGGEAPDQGDCDPATGLCESAIVNEDDAALFAQAMLELTPKLSLTAAARGDWVRVPFRDLRDPSSDGTSTFRRFSPRVGVNYQFSDDLRGYAAVSTGFRSPAALELACADANAPCPLPFSLGDDPPLAPVTVRNYEAGIDWDLARGTSLDLVGYREDVNDEIVFVASRTTAGFFQNIPRTRRQGIEATWNVALPKNMRATASYGYQRSTYESTAQLAATLPNDTPDITEPGNLFPLSPLHRLTLTFGATHVFHSSVLDGELSTTTVSSQYLRGNDANIDRFTYASGATVSGRLPAYTVAALHLTWELTRYTVSLDVKNLLDHTYQTFGLFADNPQGPLDGSPVLDQPERWLTPGYPRTVMLTVGAHF